MLTWFYKRSPKLTAKGLHGTRNAVCHLTRSLAGRWLRQSVAQCEEFGHRRGCDRKLGRGCGRRRIVEPACSLRSVPRASHALVCLLHWGRAHGKVGAAVQIQEWRRSRGKHTIHNPIVPWGTQCVLLQQGGGALVVSVYATNRQRRRIFCHLKRLAAP